MNVVPFLSGVILALSCPFFSVGRFLLPTPKQGAALIEESCMRTSSVQLNSTKLSLTLHTKAVCMQRYVTLTLSKCLHPQVMQVVREQITRTLSSKPTSLELFKNKVNALNYSEILKLRQTERLHQEETLAPPVL